MATSWTRPFGNVLRPVSTENTRPLKTISMNLLPQVVQHALQIRRQLAFECHSPAVGRMREREPGRVQERAIEVRHRPKVAGHAAVNAAVQRIADDRVADRAEVHADL